MEQLWANTRFWKKELGLLGFNIGGQTTPASETPITPIIIGDGRLTMAFSRELFKEGVLGTGIAFPTVPEGKARIRTIMTATHTKEELQQALGVLQRVERRWGFSGKLRVASPAKRTAAEKRDQCRVPQIHDILNCKSPLVIFLDSERNPRHNAPYYLS